jgi:hypothetical protein
MFSLSMGRLGFKHSRPILGFVVEKVAVGQVFVQLLSFSLVRITPLVFHNYWFVTGPV